MNNKIKTSSNRSFGIVFFIVFLIISIYPILNDENIRIWSLFPALIFLVLGIKNSRILEKIGKYSRKLGILWIKW